LFFFSSRRRHTSFSRDWSSDVCSSDLPSGAGSLRGRTVDRPLVLTVHLAAGGRDHDLAGPRIQNAALAERTVQSLYGLDELRAVDRKSVVAGKRVSAVGAHEIAPQSES